MSGPAHNFLSLVLAIKRRFTGPFGLPIAVLLALLLPACSNVPVDEGIESNDALVLRVRVMTRNYTPHTQPNETDNVIAVAGASWYTYRARVTEVVQGDYADATISFANYQHEYYLRALTRDWYVRLVPFSDQTTAKRLSTPYYVISHVFAEQDDFDAHLARLLSGEQSKAGH